MLRFDVRDPLSWTGFALGVALSLIVVALSSPEPVTTYKPTNIHATPR